MARGRPDCKLSMDYLLWALCSSLWVLKLAAAVPFANHYAAVPPSNQSAGSQPVGGLSNAQPVPKPSQYPQYDAITPAWLKCAEITGISTRLEVLPGTGWDNLASKDKGYVADMTYDTCQTTPDGKYLIPDSVVTVPLKRSRVQQYSDMYSNFNDYKSATSQSMSLDVSYSKISGSFSDDYQENKENQVFSKSTTTRAEIRQQHYLVEIKPDAELAPALKKRLLVIGNLMLSNKTAAAKYEMELIVRDYGTHMIRTVVAGGVFTQESQVKNDYVNSMEASATTVKASASASFMVSVGFKFSYSTSSSSVQDFQNNVTQSTTRTYGGPAYSPGLSANEWEEGLADALVAVDREGDPIEYTISSVALPELPEPTVRMIANGIADASKEYVQYNTHLGCTEVTSPSFNYKANLGDSSLCSLAPNNYTFGGVFQNCSSPQSYGRDVCSALQQKNPLSGGYSCPAGYEAVKLNTGSRTTSWNANLCHTEYHRCGFLWTSKCGKQVCHSQFYAAVANYETSWCVKLGEVEVQSGYLFGGIYSDTTPNLVTETKGCPKFFYPLKMGASMRVCVSDNYEQGFASSVPFAGFFSCKVGNPLSLTNSPSNQPMMLSEVGFGNLTGEQSWPAHCPHGYAQHLSAIDNSCEINYCVRAHAFDRPSRLLLQRPPYGKRYPTSGNDTVETTMVMSPSGEVWNRNATSGVWDKGTLGSKSLSAIGTSLPGPSGDDRRTGLVAGITVGGGLCCILLIALAVTCRKNQRLRNESRQPLLRDGVSRPNSNEEQQLGGSPQAPPPINADGSRQRSGYASFD